MVGSAVQVDPQHQREDGAQQREQAEHGKRDPADGLLRSRGGRGRTLVAKWGLLTVTSLRITRSGWKWPDIAGGGRLLAVGGSGRLLIPARAGLAMAPRGRLAAVARLAVLPRILRRTPPWRGEAWRRRLHPGIVTVAAHRLRVGQTAAN
jgi:hypothetical protein